MYSGFCTRLNVQDGDEGATLREVGRLVEEVGVPFGEAVAAGD